MAQSCNLGLDMSPFLEQIARELARDYGSAISELCLIVPTRRAISFLRQALMEVYRDTLWAPKMVSIQDFVREWSGQKFPDTMPLVFELYQVYLTETGQEESFERFYAWGEMLVRDFDEIDKYLVDAQQLFTNIRELKEIDLFFTLEPENLEPIRRFWETIRGRDEGPTEVQERFLRIWEKLYEVYQAFNARLRERHLAYDGMAYRRLVDELQAGARPFAQYRELVFIGFNALSSAEEFLMGHLLREKRARVYWDVDAAYFSADPKAGLITGEEPGKFIHEYHQKWKDLASHLIAHDMQATPKALFHEGVALQVGQAQYLGNLLTEAALDPQDYSRTAVVLADENLLFPVLYNLPSRYQPINITMGFPLRQTPIYHLLQGVVLLLRNQQGDAPAAQQFAHTDVLKLLNNPYIKALVPELSERLQTNIHRKNLVFVPKSLLLEAELPPLLAHVFSPPFFQPNYKLRDLSALLNYLAGIFTLLLEDSQEQESHLETEYVFHFYTQFNQLREILERFQPELSMRGFGQLFREVMQKVRIPFEGEPLIGLQIMGFLETRVLDFDRVYILGANEGLLPDTSSGNSFIPYNLRKGFGLPTYEEKDAIYAYHFYRLIQRAQEVHLVYNTVVNESGGTKEVSRFIRQMRHFFRDQLNLRPKERIISTVAPYSEPPEITIPATEETRRMLLEKYQIKPQNPKPQSLSATALSTWISCKLRFYFRYVANIREPERVAESMEANTFGSVLHETMELLYRPYLHQTLGPAHFEAMKGQISACLKQAFHQQDLGWGTQLQGKNRLLRDVIYKLCHNILEQDAQENPFQVSSLEDDSGFRTALKVGPGLLALNGTLDRIDYLPDHDRVRILDYKTGHVKLKAHTPLEELFVNDQYKESFQGWLYAWLYQRRFPDQDLIVGYYTARELKAGIRYLKGGAPFQEAELETFEDGLTDLIERLFTEDYAQTDNEQKCRYCPYKGICNRG